MHWVIYIVYIYFRNQQKIFTKKYYKINLSQLQVLKVKGCDKKIKAMIKLDLKT